MSGRDWFDAEPPAWLALRQAATLLAEGFRRPVVLALSVLVCVAVSVGALLFVERSYAPRYVLRVVEPDRDPNSMPSPRSQLREYVTQAVFTSDRLEAVMRRFDLYPSLARKNPRAAIESFREDVVVDSYHNYFVEDRSPSAAPRSARLAITFRHSDRDVAVGVTRELGRLVVEHELAHRRDAAERAAGQADYLVGSARDVLAARRAEIARVREEIVSGTGFDPERQVKLVALLGSLQELERRQDAAERRRASLALGAALERRGIAMSFEVVDDAALPTDAEARERRLMLGGASLVFGVPLVAMAVGAFAPRRRVTT